MAQLRMRGDPQDIEPYYSLAEPTSIPLYAGPLLYLPHRRRGPLSRSAER